MGAELFQTIILGIIQGLTEFLPVSSSGHLELAKYLLGTNLEGEQSLMITIILHFATALSTVFVFRRDILIIIKGLFCSGINEEKKIAWFIVISMIPAALLGVFFMEQIEWFFAGNIFLVAIMLLITGILLLISDSKKVTASEWTWKKALIVGIAQALATIPGISRSGATISTSLILDVKRDYAAKFSFLMVIPLIFGKIGKDMISGEIMTDSFNWNIITVGFITAFITGVIACKWMVLLVNRSKLKYFAYYCFALGSLTIIMLTVYGTSG